MEGRLGARVGGSKYVERHNVDTKGFWQAGMRSQN